MSQVDFPFSDLVAGYVKSFELERGLVTITTSDGRDQVARIGANCYAEVAHNLGGGYLDCTGQLTSMLSEGRFLFAYGVWYPEPGEPFEMKHVVFLGRSKSDFTFETQDWWVNQIRQLGNFYLGAQFGGGAIDWSNYRTQLDLGGRQVENTRQETDTISRLVYGFASAYLLTGDERFLEAAESGTEYLRTHFRAVDASENVTYWYHAIEFTGDQAAKRLTASPGSDPAAKGFDHAPRNRERKMLASEFSDDYQAIPAYEQIYALAGPTQTYRISGDPLIREDIDNTINIFQRYFFDHQLGGYFSHIDPITFDPKAESLGENAGRKNWNSVGDHAPAYLINLVLATGEQQHVDMLVECANSIVEHFGDYENSAFVQEKFHADWSHDTVHGWQQNRAVVGHNLKIAWNLMRVVNVHDDPRYVDFAERIARLMPDHGWDKQRTGWYDVVERVLPPEQTVHRFAWHDRKAWWQQEQGILAYLILNGMLPNKGYEKYARESSSFYNAFFLDHDSGGVYFNVLANGLPYLLGTERMKGSHSMSGYHSFELCYLAATYTNLLNTKQPLDLYFSPKPGGFKDGILRVAPDLLPTGAVRIDEVSIDGEPYTDFDATALTVKIPSSKHRPKIRVRLAPTSGVDHFDSELQVDGSKVILTMKGDMDERALPELRNRLDEILTHQPTELELDFTGVESISPPAIRAIVMTEQHLAQDIAMVFRGVLPDVREALEKSEFSQAVTFI